MRLCFTLVPGHLNVISYTITVLYSEKTSPKSLSSLATREIATCLGYDETVVNRITTTRSYPSTLLLLISNHIREMKNMSAVCLARSKRIRLVRSD
jgi:hypothetical protein